MRKNIFLILVMTLFIPAVLANSVQVTSTFDKKSVRVGEEIHLTIRVTGAMGNIQAPRLPGYKGIDTFYTGRVSNISFINGQSSSTVDFSYILVPRVAGNFTLDPIQVSVQNSLYRTEAISIEVLPGVNTTATAPSPQPANQTQPNWSPPVAAPSASSTPVQAPAIREGVDDENIFVQAWTDRNVVYPNEQVLLSYSLYTRYDTRYDGFEEEPEISGFWIEEFPMERDVERETVRVKGKRYVKADIRKIALFPTTPADYVIKPGVLRVSVRKQPQQTSIFDDFFDDSFFSGGSFFARRENRLLKPAELKLTVRPFPERDKPDSFDGAVGNFTMIASLNKKAVNQNEPITMTLILEGQGNIETLNKPKIPELAEFKIYESDTSTQLFKSGHVIGGKKTFEIVFIPRAAGEKKIPALEFSFFDPRETRYQTLRTPVFDIQVSPSEQVFELPKNLTQNQTFKKDIEIEGHDIHYIMEKLEGGEFQKHFDNIAKGLLAADGALFLFLLFSFFKLRRKKIFAKDTALKRRKTAKAHAQAGMNKIKRLMRSKKEEKTQTYFVEASKLMTRYLSDKFNLSTLGGTRMEIEERLREMIGSEDPLFKEIREFYSICDGARFGGFMADREHQEQVMGVIQKTIQKIEKVCR